MPSLACPGSRDRSMDVIRLDIRFRCVSPSPSISVTGGGVDGEVRFTVHGLVEQQRRAMEITLDLWMPSLLIVDCNCLNEKALTDSEACKSRYACGWWGSMPRIESILGRIFKSLTYRFDILKFLVK
jgi:hypothetical protein